MLSDKMVDTKEFSKYERARIIGARGLQVSMDAPLLKDMSEKELDDINYDPLKIAEVELDSGVLPISVNKPMPEKQEEALENIKVDNSVPSDEEKIKAEKEIEKEIAESGSMNLDDSGENDESPVATTGEVGKTVSELE